MATRMALRKREPPPTVAAALAKQRDALISRLAKRPRHMPSFKLSGHGDGDGDSDSDETESEYEPRTAPRKRTVKAAAAMRKRQHCAPLASPTDRALTFLQSAQLQNNPVRSGKWNEEEELYLRKLVQVFHSGLLDDVEPRMSMRMWLAKMLHCCPMRISKKQMHGEKFKGKAKYARNSDRIDRMGQKEFDRTWHEMHQLRSNFLKHWAKEEFVRFGFGDRARDFGEWYDTVVRNVPTPKLARNARLRLPAGEKVIEPWAQIRKDLEVVANEDQEAINNRAIVRKKKASQRYATKKMLATAADSTASNHGQAPLSAYQVVASVAPLLNLDLERNDVIFEPMPSPDLDWDESLSDQELWQMCSTVPSSPLKPVNLPVLDDEVFGSQLSSNIVLDFGPPSEWNVDPISKDVKSPNTCEWVDDLLGDDMLLTFDPAMLTPCDLTSDSWLQQIISGFAA